MLVVSARSCASKSDAALGRDRYADPGAMGFEMSKHNKVNKSNYDQGGRLTPDELAREYKKQTEISSHAKGKERVTGKTPESGGAPADTPRQSESEE